MGSEPGWRQAEAAYEDEVVGEGSLAGMFESSAARNADREAQWYKGGIYERSLTPDPLPAAPDGEYAALTYAEMRSVVRNLAAGFRSLGLASGDRVALYADTRMEWAQCDFAVLSAGGVVTTVPPDSEPAQVEHLVAHPGATGAVVENETLLSRLRAVEESLDLEWVVVIDEVGAELDREDVLTLGDVHDRGATAFDPNAYETWLGERGPESLATVVYTSGTTGQPRGVRLRHRNLRATVSAVRKRFGPRPDKDPDLPTLDVRGRTLSFLPLAHSFERTVGHFCTFASGATVAYAEGPDTLAEDVRLVEPTVLTGVPRVYERIYDRMRDRAAGSPISERVFRWAGKVARAYGRADDPGPLLRARHRLADRLVYDAVADQLGGEVEFFVSGGGPLDPELAERFLGMDLPIVEAYGLTETAAVVSASPPEDVRPGTLGVPLHGVEVRLDESVAPEDVEPTADGDLGELLVHGQSVADGYWDDDEATDAAFVDLPPASGDDVERERRWFRTGDLVEVTGEDYLVYHGRLRELLVLSTGRHVAPRPIEAAFATSDRVSQILVLGDGREYVGALVVPDAGALQRWADEEDVALPGDTEAIADHPRVREWVGEAVESVNAELADHATIRGFELSPEEWTQEADLLSASMNKRRTAILERYADRVDRIYAEE